MTTSPQMPERRKVSTSPEADAEQVERAALNLRFRTGAAYLSAEFKGIPSSTLPLESLEVYLQQLMEDAGQPSDPVVRIMLEQLAMAHHKIGRLNRLSAEATTLDEAKVNDAASACLLGELRRLALAIKEYRSPAPTQHVTLVKQQNVAQHQQVALVDGRSRDTGVEAARPEKKAYMESELGSKRNLEHVAYPITIAQPTPCSSRQTQPAATKRPVRRSP